jgi:V/A-type H+-transporting ATPase subunit E
MSGLSNIVELIEIRANEKIEQIMHEAEKEREKVLNRAKEKAEIMIKKKIKEAKVDLEAELTKYGASATLGAKHRILEIKESLLKEVLEKAAEQLKKKTKTKGYKKILSNLATHGAKVLNEEEIELVFPKGHEKKIKVTTLKKHISDKLGKKIKVKISKEHIRASGGVKIQTPDYSKWVDNTFEARFERLDTEIRDKIAELLFVGKRW